MNRRLPEGHILARHPAVELRTMTHFLQRSRLIRREESGQAMVEFALVLPLLLILILAVVDFGRAFNFWIEETHLANAGARWAAVNRNPGVASTDCPGTLQAHIQCKATTDELSTSAEVNICLREAGLAAVGKPMEVRVETDFAFRFISVLLPVDSIRLAGSATMRLEAVPTNYSYFASDACPA
jgi:Flp pilus assembly protein TadG